MPRKKVREYDPWIRVELYCVLTIGLVIRICVCDLWTSNLFGQIGKIHTQSITQLVSNPSKSKRRNDWQTDISCGQPATRSCCVRPIRPALTHVAHLEWGAYNLQIPDMRGGREKPAIFGMKIIWKEDGRNRFCSKIPLQLTETRKSQSRTESSGFVGMLRRAVSLRCRRF